MSLTNSMQTLRSDIRASHGKRRQDLKGIRHDTRRVQQDAHNVISDFEKTRKEQAEKQANDLTSFTEDLSQDVKSLRHGFRKDQAEIREDVLGASRVWHGKASVKDVPETKENEEE